MEEKILKYLYCLKHAPYHRGSMDDYIVSNIIKNKLNDLVVLDVNVRFTKYLGELFSVVSRYPSELTHPMFIGECGFGMYSDNLFLDRLFNMYFEYIYTVLKYNRNRGGGLFVIPDEHSSERIYIAIYMDERYNDLGFCDGKLKLYHSSININVHKNDFELKMLKESKIIKYSNPDRFSHQRNVSSFIESNLLNFIN